MAGRHDAVEHVDAARHRLDDVLRAADAHQVARLVPRACSGTSSSSTRSRSSSRLADRETADREARRSRCPRAPVQRRRAQRSRACRPARCRTAPPAASSPRVVGAWPRAAQRIDSSIDARASRLGRRIRRALIEAHRDVRAEHALDAHRLLRRQEHLARRRPASGNSTPSSVILRSFARLNTWKPPESVRIGRCQCMKPCRPRCALDDLEPGPQPQVEGVAEHDLGADASRAPRGSSP